MASFGPRFSAASVIIAFRARVKRALGCKLPGEKAARRALRIISGRRGETADLLAEVDPRAGLHLMPARRCADCSCAGPGLPGSQPAIGYLILDKLRRSGLLAQLHRSKHRTTKSIENLYVGLRRSAFSVPIGAVRRGARWSSNWRPRGKSDTDIICDDDRVGVSRVR
jgi:hypothetical protein